VAPRVPTTPIAWYHETLGGRPFTQPGATRKNPMKIQTFYNTYGEELLIVLEEKNKTVLCGDLILLNFTI
jgi:hypothetical protein